jgi:hypothetical protein
MEVIEIFVRICALSSGVNHDYILASEAQEGLEGICVLVRALCLNSGGPCVVDTEKTLGELAELLLGLSCDWSLVQSHLVCEYMFVSWISIVKI